MLAAEHFGPRKGHIPSEAPLSDFLDSKFNVASYNSHRKFLAQHGTYLLPYSSKIRVDENWETVNLQALTDFTTTSLIRVISVGGYKLQKNLCLHCKWGCDGSSGQWMNTSRSSPVRNKAMPPFLPPTWYHSCFTQMMTMKLWSGETQPHRLFLSANMFPIYKRGWSSKY